MIFWTKAMDEKLIEYRKQHSQRITAQMLTKEFNEKFTKNGVKNREHRIRDAKYKSKQLSEYQAKITHNEDGSMTSDKLIEISEKQLKDKSFLLEAHGYDSNDWEVISASSSIWNQHNKQDGTLTLYASKIKVKPKTDGFNLDRLIKAIENRKPAKPIKFSGETPKEPTYLEIPLFDLHFGNSTLEYYTDTLRKTLELLEKSYNEVLFIIGQDLLHNDNFKGETANGTKIDKVDMEIAWEEAEQFYVTLIDKALEKSLKVSVIFIKGNHDESMSWAFVRDLKSYYRKEPKITFDTLFKERKAHMLGLNFIGTTHGDKNRNNAASNFSVEFPEMWAKATTREVHMGHLHRKRATKKPIEFIIDSDGVIVRELGSGNDIDQYHDDNGYTMAHKEFEIFEYTETKKKRIHYV